MQESLLFLYLFRFTLNSTSFEPVSCVQHFLRVVLAAPYDFMCQMHAQRRTCGMEMSTAAICDVSACIKMTDGFMRVPCCNDNGVEAHDVCQLTHIEWII